jgi:hypothetical protein
MKMPRVLCFAPLAGAALLCACASPAPTVTPPSVTIPDSLRLSATGVQIYECRAATAGASDPEWVFVAPEATLTDAQGAAVGRHYAGPTWEAKDGSKIVGVVKAKADAPGSIPWLLLTTHSTGQPGLFAKVVSVQRVATAGGAMPTTGCGTATVGQVARVPYTAQYTQYAPK